MKKTCNNVNTINGWSRSRRVRAKSHSLTPLHLAHAWEMRHTIKVALKVLQTACSIEDITVQYCNFGLPKEKK